ncbi:hypothetical protein N0824_00490 [Microcystis sp. 0824]|uniref:hypothetical protein n=1 Tax=Microcystis sp. 0824 TaxID=1502726 RepID=UPI000D0C4E43|nr:hypothetical protein [Microcystis sp. 0824]GBF52641.1 hypothetical protein N0824_00490 [Microcystis sp. 0824]
MNTQTLIKETQEWLDWVNQPFTPGMLVQSFNAPQIMNPANAAAVGDYKAKADSAASPGSAPVSVFEGMQTTANLSRVRAEFNPIDVEGTGNKAHFLQFTQNIADAPFLTLLSANTLEVKEKSHNADTLINSFVGGFIGLAESDIAQVLTSVKTLASAALSYAGQQERVSNFAQNLLQVDSSGDVQFSLYSSEFSIKSENNKGTITFEASYFLVRAQYQLSVASWNQVVNVFSAQQKTDTQSWLDQMSTKNKSVGAAKTPCLD